MFPNCKTPVQTTTLRGTKTKSSASLNTAPDPIKDAYKLKSQIDAVQKSQQSFKTSEIIQIQTKLLTKAWKWISKYGIGSLNQYTKMKKQIQNYDVLIKTIASMQGNIETHFQALHRINKQHSISLNNIQSNICINNNNLLQFKSNTNKYFKHAHNDKRQIVSLLTKTNQSIPPSIDDHQSDETPANSPNEPKHSTSSTNTENTIFPLTKQQIDDVENNNINDAQMVLSAEQQTETSEHDNNSDSDEPVKKEDADTSTVHEIESDAEDSVYPELPSNVHKASNSFENVPAYKFQELLSLSDTELNDNSMMKETSTKTERSRTELTEFNQCDAREKSKSYDFRVTDKENKMVDEIMENLTKLEALSQDFNNFMQNDSEQYKSETQQVIKSKLKPLHEILEQRELGLLSELKYLHKEKMMKIKQRQHVVQQNKNYLQMKLVQCQNILQQYQTKWEQQYKILHARVDKNILQERKNIDFNNLFKDNFEKKVQNVRANLIKERKNELNLINNEVNQQIELRCLEKDIANLKQMYIFTVNSANLYSLKEQLQNLGEFVDFAAQNNKNGKLFKKYRISPKNSMSETDENNRKFSKSTISKKFNELIGRHVQNPSITTNQSQTASMNLDEMKIEMDALSISSGNQSDTNVNKSNTNLNVDRFQNDNHRNRPSVSISTSAPQSDINSDLP